MVLFLSRLRTWVAVREYSVVGAAIVDDGRLSEGEKGQIESGVEWENLGADGQWKHFL